MYNHDIFLSYAYVDNELLPSTPLGWVDTLVKILDVRLAQKLGRQGRFTLWSDKQQIPGNQPIHPEIEQAIADSASFLAILSRGYLESPWCWLELESFLRTHPAAAGRLFVVYRDRVEAGDRPPAFEGIRGYQFWEEGKGRAVRIWGDPVPDPQRDADYYALLNDLSQDLADLIDRDHQSGAIAARTAASTPAGAVGNGAAIQGLFGAAAIAPPPVTQSHPIVGGSGANSVVGTVFLAQPTDDLISIRNAVRRHLQSAGIQVLPETWCSHDPEVFAAAATTDLGQSDLFVQLLGAVAGSRAADLPRGFNGLQHELAIRADKAVLQWRPLDLDPATVEEQDHRGLLEGATVVACGIEDFKKMVVDRIEAAKAPPVKPSASNTVVFIDAEHTDLVLARLIGQALTKESVACILPLETGTPAEVSQDIEDSLTLSDLIVIVYGKIHALWVRQHLRWLLKIMATRQHLPRAVALLRVPPPLHTEREDPGVNVPWLRVLDCGSGLFKDEDHPRVVDEVHRLLTPLLEVLS